MVKARIILKIVFKMILINQNSKIKTETILNSKHLNSNSFIMIIILIDPILTHINQINEHLSSIDLILNEIKLKIIRL